VEHTVGPLGLGTLVVKPLRHVVHVADLDEAESAELGPLLRHTAAAVTTVIQPEQVYVCLWSHAGGAPAHIHFVVQPVTEADKTRFGALGPDLQAAMFREGAVPGEREIELVCARLRRAGFRRGPRRAHRLLPRHRQPDPRPAGNARRGRRRDARRSQR
jgi:diadenosine tetraphosphate (Ap4A) HIT family hydrolase